MASELAILRYTDDLGRTLTIPLNISQIKEWFMCFENNNPFIAYVSNEYRGVNPSKVIEWTIEGVSSDLKSLGNSCVADLTWGDMKSKLKQNKTVPEESVPSKTDDSKVMESSVRDQPPSADTTSTGKAPLLHDSKKNTLYKVECKCGENYLLYYYNRSTKNYCKQCKQIVFVDYSAGKLQTDEGDAWIMTNKRFVVRQPHPDDITMAYTENTKHTTGLSTGLDKWLKKNGHDDKS